MRRALVTSLLVMAGCTSLVMAGCTSADDAVLSPAPTPCPAVIVRADSVPSTDLVDRMQGHVPVELPEGFGLAQVWGEGEGFMEPLRGPMASVARFPSPSRRAAPPRLTGRGSVHGP